MQPRLRDFIGALTLTAVLVTLVVALVLGGLAGSVAV